MTSKAKVDIVGEDKTGAAWGSAVKTAKGAADKMKGMFKAAFAGLGVAVVAGFTKQILDFGEEVSNATKKAKISTEAFTELAFAYKQTGGDAAGLSNALKFMQINISKASDGSKEQLEAFDALGISVKAFKQLAPEKQFEVIADRISKLTDEEDRARAATALLGKSGADLLPLFEDGAAGIKKAREEAQKMNQSFSAEQIARLDEAGDAIDRMKGSFSGLATVIIAKAAPALTRFFDALSGAGDPIEKANKQIKNLEGTLQSFGKGSAGREDIEGRIRQLRAFTQAEEARRKRARGEFNPKGRGASSAANDAPPGFDSVAAKEAAAKAAKEAQKEWDKFLKELDKENVETNKQIREAWLESTEEVGAFNGGWIQVFNKTMDEMAAATAKTTQKMSVFWEQGMRNMQDVLADTLFNSFDNGVRGMLKSFLDVIRRMAAEAAAAKIFEKLSGAAQNKQSGIGKLFNLGRSLFGFEHGGSFKVGGHGPNDSQVVAFRASPNERVSITPPGRGKDGGINVTTIVNVKGSGVTREEVISAVQQGTQQTIVAIRDMRRRGTL